MNGSQKMSKLVLGIYGFLLFMTGVFSAKMYDKSVIDKRFDIALDRCKLYKPKYVVYKGISYKNVDCAVLAEIYSISKEI
jgi:hypothetical protein